MGIISSSILNVFARISSITSTFLCILILGRMLSPSEFGVWAWFFTLFSLITAQDFGLITAMRVRLGDAIRNVDCFEQKILFSTTFLTVSALVILFFLLFVISGYSFEPQYTLQLRIVIAVSLLTVLGYTSSQGLLANLNSKRFGLIEISRSLLQILAITIAFFIGIDFQSTVIFFYVTSAFYLPISLYLFLSSKKWSIEDLFCVTLVKSSEIYTILNILIKHGAMQWLLQVGLAALMMSDVFILGFIVPNDQVALANTVVRLVMLGVGFVMALMTPISGHFIARLNCYSVSQIKMYYTAGIALLFVIGAVYGIFLYFFGPQIIFVWSNLHVERTYGLFCSGLLFSTLSTIFLLQVFFQFPIFCRVVLPIIFFSVCLKIILVYVTVTAYGYQAAFLASFISCFFFVSCCSYILLRANYLSRLMSTC